MLLISNDLHVIEKILKMVYQYTRKFIILNYMVCDLKIRN